MSLPEYQEFPAPPPLDSLIHCFWFLRGPMGGSGAQPVLPDGRVEIVLHLAEPFAEVDSSGTARGQAEALLAGQLTAPFHLLPRGDADVIGIRFRSAGARSVLGFPAAEVTGQVVPLALVERRMAGEFLEAAARARGRDDAKVEALSAVIRRYVRRQPTPLVVEAVRSLERSPAVRVRELAGRLGVSSRTLERRVMDVVGLAPSLLQRVFRFKRALRLLERTPRGAWSSAALRAGYFDQAHLIRDFRQFAGMPPSAFFAADAPLSKAIQGDDEGER